MERMRICQVISSNIPIMPTGKRGWGATELIMDEYTKNLRRLGHSVEIKWLAEVRPKQYDIVHIHVANLCHEAQKMGIEYIYSTHDHHSYFHGKYSWNYNEQLKAIKGSILSFAPAEYVVDYFDDTDKLFFLMHGVDTNYYTPLEDFNGEHKLLICANNGVAGDSGADRKGFRVGIEAAKRLNLPITIVGADANREFFKIHTDLLQYDRLTVIDNNPTEEEKVNIFKKHTILLHPSNLEYGHPCLSQLEAISMCMPVVGTYKGTKEIDGFYRIENQSTEQVLDGIILAMHEYDMVKERMRAGREQYDWMNVCKKLEHFYSFALKNKESYSTERSRELYTKAYNETIKI